MRRETMSTAVARTESAIVSYFFLLFHPLLPAIPVSSDFIMIVFPSWSNEQLHLK
jgi:hypothetical protein